MENIKSACFTGHRNFSEVSKEMLFEKLVETIRNLYEKENVTNFYNGGAFGFDELAAKAVIYLRDLGRLPIKLFLVLPCPSEYQTKYWNLLDTIEHELLIKASDVCFHTSKKYHRSCMFIRNKELVNRANSFCICYMDPERKSGTSQTVNFAIEKGLKILNLFPF